MAPIPPNLRIALLAAGTVLLLVALFVGGLFGAGTRPRLALRLVVGVIGLALIGWVLPSYLPGRATGAAPAAKARMPVDLVRLASAEVSACSLPSPPTLPDAASASLQDMSTARQAFEAYDAATNAYVKCVDAAVDRVAQQHGGTASARDLAGLKLFGATAHNTAIDQEQAVANQFNTQLRAYKARHPK